MKALELFGLMIFDAAIIVALHYKTLIVRSNFIRMPVVVVSHSREQKVDPTENRHSIKVHASTQAPIKVGKGSSWFSSGQHRFDHWHCPITPVFVPFRPTLQRLTELRQVSKTMWRPSIW
jgi:hypothetical protein